MRFEGGEGGGGEESKDVLVHFGIYHVPIRIAQNEFAEDRRGNRERGVRSATRVCDNMVRNPCVVSKMKSVNMD
jgi:hypothetical protein